MSSLLLYPCSHELRTSSAFGAWEEQVYNTRLFAFELLSGPSGASQLISSTSGFNASEFNTIRRGLRSV